MTEQVCPVCKGAKELVGRSKTLSANFGADVVIECPNHCDDSGKVSAKGALAQWREEATKLVGHVEANLGQPDVRTTLDFLRDHLAAMPQPSVNQAKPASEPRLEGWRTVAQDAMKLLRGRPGWDAEAEVQLAWWRKAKDQCAAYDKFLTAAIQQAEAQR